MAEDWSLTAPKTPQGRDVHVFAAVEGKNYPELAYAAWLEAQATSRNLDGVTAEYTRVLTRLEAGRRWLDTHASDDPAYPRARQLRHEFDQQVDTLAIQRECLARAVWVSCCNVFAALAHIGPTPEATWRLLRHHEPPPGAWPPSKEEWIVDGRPQPRYVATWQIGELVEQLAERKTG